jgi:exodeoxyribonuclease VII small subunit
MTLEKKIKRLETLVENLESEDVDLESAIQHYGDAVKLASEIMTVMKAAEGKLAVIQKEAGKIKFS